MSWSGFERVAAVASLAASIAQGVRWLSARDRRFWQLVGALALIAVGAAIAVAAGFVATSRPRLPAAITPALLALSVSAVLIFRQAVERNWQARRAQHIVEQPSQPMEVDR